MYYPDSARENNIRGMVKIWFIINTDGSISDCKIIRGLGYGCDKEALRLVKYMGDMVQPSKIYGKLVKDSFTINIYFSPDHDQNIYKNADENPKASYDVNKYLADNLKIPPSANDQKGKVTVIFVVNKDGTISDCRVSSGINKLYNDEALRLIKNMPKWIPGRIDNKKVNVYRQMNITF